MCCLSCIACHLSQDRPLQFICNKTPSSSFTRIGCRFHRYTGCRMLFEWSVKQGPSTLCRVIRLCRCCGLLRFCPQVALLLWAHAKERLLSAAAVFSKQDMLELAMAAVRAASFTVGADGMHAPSLVACADVIFAMCCAVLWCPFANLCRPALCCAIKKYVVLPATCTSDLSQNRSTASTWLAVPLGCSVQS